MPLYIQIPSVSELARVVRWWRGGPTRDLRPLKTLNSAQTHVAQIKAKEQWATMEPAEQAQRKQVAAGEEANKLDRAR